MFEIFLGTRYLKAKRKQAFISVALPRINGQLPADKKIKTKVEEQ